MVVEQQGVVRDQNFLARGLPIMPSTGLPEIVNSLEDIDERLHQFYDRDETGAFRLTDIRSLKNAKDREKEEKKRWKQTAVEYEQRLGGIGKDELEELISIRERQKQEEVRQLEERRQWEALKQQMEDNHKRQIEGVKSESQRNWGLLEQYYRNTHLRHALEERGATDTGKKILPELLANRVRLTLDEEGHPKLNFYDSNGKQIHVNAKNEDFTINDFMEEIYHNYDDLFVGANKSGTGATITAKHAARQNILPSKMTDRQKADFINQYGEESYRQLLMVEIQKKNDERAAQAR